METRLCPFNDRWMGRGGPFEWPPCSPDLTLPDSFLWGYIKNVVQSKKSSLDLQVTLKIDLKVMMVKVMYTLTFHRLL